MSIFKKALGVIRGERPAQLPAQMPERRPGASYMRGGRGIAFEGWRPWMREQQDEVASSWDAAAARVMDAVHNSGWLAGALDQAVANTVGTGLRLKSQADLSALGLSPADSRAWARRVEQRFEQWAGNKQECDIEGIRTFGQMQSTAFASWLATGEILAELPHRKRPWNTYSTKVRLLPPMRLSRRTNYGQRLMAGVYLNRDGMPYMYRAIVRDPLRGYYEKDVMGIDYLGRPRVLHIFNGPPQTYRGISPMTPALQVARQFDKLADATLTAAILQTMFAISVTGDAPTDEVLEAMMTPEEQAKLRAEGQMPIEAYMSMVGGYYDGSAIDTGLNGRVAHLFPGQEMNFHGSQHPNPNYAAYARHLLREIARCLGLTYESATGDYEGATYSSVRMASGEAFAITKMRRQNVVVPFCQPSFEAWLEEEIELGLTPLPGGIEAFHANRAAICKAQWRGSPKPQADDQKAALAHQIWRNLGVISDDMIANDLGVDIEDVYDERAAEAEMRKERGLIELVMPGSVAPGSALPGDGENKAADNQKGEQG